MEREVTIGLDFGTSTTKVGFGAFDEREAHVVPSPQGGSLFWPSAVGAGANDDLYFAEGAATAVRQARWLKLAVTDRNGTDNRFSQAIARQFECGAEELAAIYLAWVIHEATAAAHAQWPADDLHLACNLGAPLALTSEASQCDRFDRIVRVAMALAPQARQGWPAAEALAACREIGAQPAPSEFGRTGYVVPETHAAVTGTLLDRSLPDGHYAAIDVGAGTTDIAVFLYKQPPRNSNAELTMYGKAAYFVDASHPVASYDVDFNLTQLIWNATHGLDRPCGREKLQDQVRLAKERSGNIVTHVPGWPAAPQDRAKRMVADLCHKLGQCYFLTWYQAFEKDKHPDHWPGLNILLLGGGSRFEPFRSQFARHPLAARGDPLRICPGMRIRTWPVDYGDRLVTRVGGRLTPVTECSLLTVLYGLTRHPGEIPEHFRPGSVAPVDLPKPPESANWRFAGRPWDATQ